MENIPNQVKFERLGHAGLLLANLPVRYAIEFFEMTAAVWGQLRAKPRLNSKGSLPCRGLFVF